MTLRGGTIPPLYAGLDLGSKRTRVHIRNAEGRTVYAGWARDLGELKRIVDRWGPDLSVAMEATTGAFFVRDELHGRGASELNRGELIPEVWVPSAKVRDDRELILEHARVRRTLAVEKVKIRALLSRWGLGRAIERPFSEAGLRELKRLPLPAGTQFVLGEKIGHVKELTAREGRPRKEVRRQIPRGDRERWLSTMPGVTTYSGRWLSNILGDVSRFPDGRHVASYFGLAPSERTSCAEPRRGGITDDVPGTGGSRQVQEEGRRGRGEPAGTGGVRCASRSAAVRSASDGGSEGGATDGADLRPETVSPSAATTEGHRGQAELGG